MYVQVCAGICTQKNYYSVNAYLSLACTPSLTRVRAMTHLAGDDHGRVGISVLEVEVVLAVLRRHTHTHTHHASQQYIPGICVVE